MVLEKLQACEISLILDPGKMNMRAKFGINDTENSGGVRNVWCMIAAASVRYRKI